MAGNSTDIVIVGAGIAGLVAAHECLERGRSVTLVERHEAASVGGLARTAFGGMALVGTPLQKKMGIGDSPGLALADWHSLNGEEGVAVLTGARHDSGSDYPEAKQQAKQQPVLLVFGTGHGLADELYKPERPCLFPVRAGRYNHLSVRTAAAIILDRLLGEQGSVLSLPSIRHCSR